MGADNLDDITLFLSDPVAARKKSRQDRDEFLEVTPEQLAASWRHCSPAPIWRRSTTTSPSTWSAR